jgi:hypothetical protein
MVGTRVTLGCGWVVLSRLNRDQKVQSLEKNYIFLGLFCNIFDIFLDVWCLSHHDGDSNAVHEHSTDF